MPARVLEPPYAAGRFSNGPVWIEGLASGLGLSISPNASGGNNYAVGGALTGDLAAQIASFDSDHAGAADPSALYVVWAGSNDGILEGDPLAAAATLVQAIQDLSILGAEYFLVPNLPDLSITPQGSVNGQQFSLDFNDALATGLAALAGVTVFDLDAFSLFNEMVANPAAFGFTNVSAACWNGITVCGDPSEYLFWDRIHPTSAAHAFVASAAVAAVPEPGTAFLVVVGLLVLVERRRYRA